MSDAIREAFEALDKLYVAEERKDRSDLYNTVKAALSANGGEAITPVWDNKVLVSNIVRAFWRRIYTYKDRYPAKELPREVPVELYCAMSTALMHLDNESLNPKHPAPPSVAVPEQQDSMIPAHFNVDECRGFRTGYNHLRNILTAPQPNHSTDAGKVVQGKNRYGLDMGYFARLITREFGDLRNFRPDEFARVCARMAATADASVLQEKEFHAIPSVPEEETGKVVQGEPVAFGYVDPNVYNKGSVGGGISKTPTDTRTLAVYTHPAESREEVQAQGLEDFAFSVWAKFVDQEDRDNSEEVEKVIGEIVLMARRKAREARLRASQQEGNTAGDDGEGE